MTLDLAALDKSTRVLFRIELTPLQGERFQPTGFPSLGAATYQGKKGQQLLVESAQSMANRFETTCWDTARNQPIKELAGISHVTVTRENTFLTDTMLESHRLNSPYLLVNEDRGFLDPFLTVLRERLGSPLIDDNVGLVKRSELAKALLRFDVGSLLHGCFLSSNKVKLTAQKKPGSLAGGRLRVARSLSCFIEASGVRVAASGGVKNDHVHPSGVAEDGFGNVPFARDEFTAERVDCYINLDLAQIRGYGLGTPVERLLVVLALHRVRRLLDGDLRLRTACDFEVVDPNAIVATRPAGFRLPDIAELEKALPGAIGECKELMVHTTVTFDGELKKGKDDKKTADDVDAEADDAADEDGADGEA